MRTELLSQSGGVMVDAPSIPGHEQVLTPEAVTFVAELARRFTPAIHEALGRRAERRTRFAAGESLDFLPETAEVRAGNWRVAPTPRDLIRRVVEITGPAERKMIINALNSGADVFMADFEDSLAPTWRNLIEGQRSLIGAVRHELTHHDPETGKSYRLSDRTAVLLVRPRGLHLIEKRFLVDGRPIPASLFDFGLYFFHNAAELVRRDTGPYFYLPKMESHLEARLWNEVFVAAQAACGIPRGTIRATCLIETLPAAFEMDEILYELREHSSGLNCGRWDYIFSTIKTRRDDPRTVLPDRSQVTMEQPCMRAYTQLTVRTCHRRGAHAIGGMAAQIPIKNDSAAGEAALARVRADKRREVLDGHDGTWVAHPGLVAIAREAFAAGMEGPNQLERMREDVRVGAARLLEVPTGTRTEEGLRLNLRVGVQYLEAWLAGVGCVPLYHLMEDAATAEISRTQIWHWLRHGALLTDGRPVTPARVEGLLDEELARIEARSGRRAVRRRSLRRGHPAVSRGERREPARGFLTLPAYDALCAIHDHPTRPSLEPPADRR
mgnify:CR=1 FL=1